MNRSSSLCTLVILFASGTVCLAGPMVTISAPVADLSRIQVGDTVRFDVILSGLNPGDRLEFLGVSVRFPEAVFGAPENVISGLTPDGIIPQSEGFTGLRLSGEAVGIFDSQPTLPTPSGLDYEPITANGLFFSFTVKALAEGTGVVSLGGNMSSTGFDATGASLNSVVGRNQLAFTVSAAGVGSRALPEPSSAVLLGIGALVAWACVPRRRGRRPV